MKGFTCLLYCFYSLVPSSTWHRVLASGFAPIPSGNTLLSEALPHTPCGLRVRLLPYHEAGQSIPFVIRCRWIFSVLRNALSPAVSLGVLTPSIYHRSVSALFQPGKPAILLIYHSYRKPRNSFFLFLTFKLYHTCDTEFKRFSEIIKSKKIFSVKNRLKSLYLHICFLRVTVR